MIAATSITAAHAEALLKATPPEQRSDVTPPKPEEPKGDPLEQIVRLEKEMNQVQVKYKVAEDAHSDVSGQPFQRHPDGHSGVSGQADASPLSLSF
jgi:hypothetical protein